MTHYIDNNIVQFMIGDVSLDTQHIWNCQSSSTNGVSNSMVWRDQNNLVVDFQFYCTWGQRRIYQSQADGNGC